MDNVNSQSQHSDHFPNDSLAADWDVVHEIVESRRQLNHPPTITHIKGHQDKHKSYEQLSLPAQLNVDADALADSYMIHHQDQHRKAPLLPHSGCLLHLPEGTITNQLKRELVIAKRGPPLRTLLRNKFQWTPEVEATIDWSLHGHAIRNTRHKSTFIKFIFGYLPVGWRVHKHDPKYSETCASCKHMEPKVETIVHLHECPSESRTKWRRVIQQQVRVSLEQWHTHPDLLSFFLRCLATAVDNDPPPQATDTNPLFHSALQEQAAIGWPQLLQGRWSKQWQLIHMNTHTTPNHSKKKPNHWSNAILKTLWEQWFDMWDTRNKDRHGHDAASVAAAEREQLQREVTQLYGSY